MINEAMRWRSMGVSTIPIKPDSKHFDTAALKKCGYCLADLKEKLPTLDDLKYWFDDGSSRKLAIVSGGIVVLDFDSFDQYERFKKEYLPLSYTFTVKSPSKGYHLHYVVSESLSQDVKVTWEDVELKHSGRPIIVAGSGYEVMPNGLLNQFTMLKLTNVLSLPMIVKREVGIRPTKKESGNKTDFSFSWVHGQNPIHDIKRALSPAQYLQSLGHELQPLPNNRYITSCPFHSDENPSFWIDNSQCNCYREDCANKRSMDVLDLYGRLNNCSLRQSIRELVQLLGGNQHPATA